MLTTCEPVVFPVSLDHVQCGPECVVDQTCGESGVLSIMQLDDPQAILSYKGSSFM